MIAAFILGLKNGWVKPIAWFGFCLQDFSRLLSWSLYTPKSCTLCGSHVQSQEDVSIVCNRFETKLKTTCLIPIYSCKKKFSLWPCRNFFVDHSCSFKIAGYSLLELVHLSCQMPRPQSTLYQFFIERPVEVPLNACLKWNFSFHLTSSFVIGLFLSASRDKTIHDSLFYHCYLSCYK